MFFRTSFIITISSFIIASCGEKSDPVVPQIKEKSTKIEQTPNSEIEEPVAEKTPTIVSFDKNSSFTLSQVSTGENPATGTDNYDIFLSSSMLAEPTLISQDLSFSDVDPTKHEDIPNEAVFAYSTWFAGGGEVYYGIVENGVLKIYQKFEDEGMEEEGKFMFFREIDPNVPTKKPDYYIVYDSDDDSSNGLMIAFSQDGKALFAKYEGQSRHLKLNFTEDMSKGRYIVEFYEEIVNENVNGTYKISHSGVWDYAQYIVKSSNKQFDFTINHDRSIKGDKYRTRPSF